MKKLVPTPFHTSRASDFVRSFTDKDRYYLFIGDHVANPSDTVASEVVSGVQLATDQLDNMIQGRMLTGNDVSLMINRVTWTPGVVYPEYTHLEDRQCHVIVETGGTSHIYKCIDNADGNTSTVAPTLTDPGPINTTDGYTWKYIYTLDIGTFNKFKTPTKIPFVSNTTNEAAAVPGAVDVVAVITGGVGYNNYFSGQFRAGDIAVTATTYKLLEIASNVNNFYIGCIIKVSTPGSPAFGQFRKITGYSVAGSVKTITIASAFSPVPVTTDSYDIYPAVEIFSTNSSANVAVAWAIVNSMQANTIGDIEVLSPGSNHRSATAVVNAHSSVSVANTAKASVLPIISPPKGHGGDPVNELGATFVGISSEFNPNETAVPQANEFRSVGVIKNPKFDNVVLTANGTGFIVGEKAVQYEKVASFTANVTLTGTALVGDAGSTFLQSLRSGDTLRVANTTAERLATISTVNSNTTATAAFSVGTIAGTAILTRLTGDGKVAAANATTITLNSASPTFSANSFVYGMSYQCARPITGVTFNGKSSSSTFVQATMLVGTITSGTFALDEIVKTSSSASGRLLAVKDNGNATFTLFLTNITGSIGLTNITGQTSGAVFNTTAKYKGDLAFDQGQLIYIENVVPITRDASKKETIKIVLEL